VAKIVVGVDGSEEARRALGWAAAEARLRHASLRVVHAYQGPASFTQEGTAADRARAEAELIVKGELASIDCEAVDAEATAVAGSAPFALLQASKDADLLVVGSRGRHGFPGLLLGSVSQQLAHHARCPVVIVPPARDAQ